MITDCADDGIGREEAGRETAEKAENPAKKPSLLTAKEAAAMCRISESMFRKMHKENKTPRAVSMGNLKRWINTEIEAWIVAGCPENDSGNNSKK